MSDNFSNPAKVAAFRAKWHAVPGSDCLIWSRSCDQGGTPQVGWNGGVASARRIAWQVDNGPIPEGKIVASSCGVRTCGAPAHLYLCTPSERLSDRERLGGPRHVARNKPRGQLSDADVRTIKAMIADGQSPISRPALADTFDVSVITITRIWAEGRKEEQMKATYLAQDRNRTPAPLAMKAPLLSFNDIDPMTRACVFLLGHGDYAGQFTPQQIAVQFNISPGSVRRIWREEEASQRAGADIRAQCEEERRQAGREMEETFHG